MITTTEAQKTRARQQAEATSQAIATLNKATIEHLASFDGALPFGDLCEIADRSSDATTTLNAELGEALNAVLVVLDASTAPVIDPTIAFSKRCQVLRRDAYLCQVEHSRELRILLYGDDMLNPVDAVAANTVDAVAANTVGTVIVSASSSLYDEEHEASHKVLAPSTSVFRDWISEDEEEAAAAAAAKAAKAAAASWHKYNDFFPENVQSEEELQQEEERIQRLMDEDDERMRREEEAENDKLTRDERAVKEFRDNLAEEWLDDYMCGRRRRP